MALSHEDKMRIQTFREQGLGAKAIQAAYPQKVWKLTTLQEMCRQIDKSGSLVERKVGSGRPKSARSTANITMVQEMICSQEDELGTSKSTRQIAGEMDISATSVRRIAKVDLGLSSFRRIPVQVINEATRLKKLTRSKQLIRRLMVKKTKKVFFTDEKLFYVSPPVNSQNDRVWSAGKKRDVNPQRLLVQRATFSASVMVSAGVCYGGKGSLHFVAEKAKINADYYINNLLPKLIEDCNNLEPSDFIFQRDGAPAHTSHLAQDWLEQHSPHFITKDEWPPNVWGAMLESIRPTRPSPRTRLN